ncbi:3'-5' exonuclease [Salinibacter ruber]|uniref:3'-5' exonuclease n=1 Tax=Salinibacter ruber TaxID=146919 RepID=UPI00216A81E8|nr:3'-5' exonuclease [Salinibacter ruber]MCS4172838.1 DNA polymerase III epsilon subunit-like protein [Salinibacter ruber]
MRYLFFDTETTGLPPKPKPPVTDTDKWPRVVQIAWAHVSTDPYRINRTLSYIIRPDGFTIPEDAAEVHGITTERAEAEGHPRGEVLEAFSRAVGVSDVLVAHNMSFDLPVVGAELVRLRGTNMLQDVPTICTKEASTDFCKIPFPRGGRGYKWPKLQELHDTLFGETFDDAHDAGADVKAGARCFLELSRRSIISPLELISTRAEQEGNLFLPDDNATGSYSPF